MLNFPEPPREYASIFLEETDKILPKKIDPRLRYVFFSTIAEGGKFVGESLITFFLAFVEAKVFDH